MSGEETREERFQHLVDDLVEKLKPTAIWLFGSRAEGRARPDSDWDVIVVSESEVAHDLYGLSAPHRLPVDLLPWELKYFEVDRFLPGTLPFAAFTRGRELHRAPGFVWGPMATPKALSAARLRYLDYFFEHAEDNLKVHRILRNKGVIAFTRREKEEAGVIDASGTKPQWVANSLLKALLLARGIDHGAARKLNELLALLPVDDPGRAIIAPILLDDDDDDATADPELLAAALAAVRIELQRQREQSNDHTL